VVAVVLAIIQARYSSTRFPGKSLAGLNGKPVIQHVRERAMKIRGVDLVLPAVPVTETELVRWFMHQPLGWVCLSRAPVNDVLSRFVDAVSFCEEDGPFVDTVVRITGDCPLLQPDLCDRLITEWRASGCEYGWIRTDDGTYPDGLDCEVFTRDLLMQAHMQATDSHDKEHVTPIMRRMREVFSLPADPRFNDWPKVSIDTPEDLERVSEFSRILDVA
jgi:spore coat polysaccharide biosynthesis protein SpsF (cytidylyltransferase family)